MGGSGRRAGKKNRGQPLPFTPIHSPPTERGQQNKSFLWLYIKLCGKSFLPDVRKSQCIGYFLYKHVYVHLQHKGLLVCWSAALGESHTCRRVPHLSELAMARLRLSEKHIATQKIFATVDTRPRHGRKNCDTAFKILLGKK